MMKALLPFLTASSQALAPSGPFLLEAAVLSKETVVFPSSDQEIGLPLRFHKLDLFSYDRLILEIAHYMNSLLSEAVQVLKCHGEQG